MIPSLAGDPIGAEDFELPEGGRSSTWRWYICGLLLLATVVNYMDRLTINILASPIQQEFHLNDEQYGDTEAGFGMAFAAGSLLFGWLVDRIGVYWLYPFVLIGWSAMGFMTGLSQTYDELWTLRVLLGFFEAGHFPCGLKTIQLLLAPRDRALGCSLLQSGTALGAILAPLAIRLLSEEGLAWRRPFLVIGAGGMAWIVFWFFSIRPKDLRNAGRTKARVAEQAAGGDEGVWSLVFSKRYLALAIMTICINLNWHLFRVWLPKFLQASRGYDMKEMLNFVTFYYIAADLGAIAAGALTARLARQGRSVFASRMEVFAGCGLLTTMTTAAAFLPKGPLLLGALLVVAVGGLGSYAAYYSMTQDLSLRHQGLMSGSLATITWVVTAQFHPIFGHYLDRTKRYDVVVGAAGWLPFVALIAVLLLWGRHRAGKVTT